MVRTIDILFVDDDPGLREIAQFYFETDPGFCVEMASTVDEALVKMSKREYDAIISDHCMPKRSGIELMMDLRKARPNIPFVIYSATRDIKVIKEALNNGADLFVEKTTNIVENLEQMVPHLRALVAKREEAEGYDQERMLVQQLVDGLSEMVLITDMDLKITRANRKANEVMGARMSELSGRSFADLVHPEDLDGVIGSLWSSLNNHSHRQIRFRLDLDPNIERPVELIVTPLDRTMHRAGLILSIRDADDLNNMEAVKERNCELEKLVDLARHEVTNHVNAAEGYIKALNGTSMEPYKRRFAEEALKRICLLEDRMRLIGLYKCMGTGRPIWQDLDRAVQRASEGNELGGVHLYRDIGRFEVLADPLLDEALKNIISDSLKQMNGASEINISCQVSIGGLTLVIEDDGIGISQEDKDDLFKYSSDRLNWNGLHFTKRLLMLTGIGIREVGTSSLGSRFEIIIPEGCYRYREDEENLWFQPAHRIKASN